MGDASTAIFWNPASLARADNISISGFHTNLYDPGVTYQFFGLAFPTMDWGCIGAGVFRLGISDIDQRDENNLLTGQYSDNRTALLMAYGRQISGYDKTFTSSAYPYARQ